MSTPTLDRLRQMAAEGSAAARTALDIVAETQQRTGIETDEFAEDLLKVAFELLDIRRELGEM